MNPLDRSPKTECLAEMGGARPAFCPLNRVRAGSQVRIKQLPSEDGVSHRLREIGLCEEQTVRLVTSQATVVCVVCNARLAISAQLAESILVEPIFRGVGGREEDLACASR